MYILYPHRKLETSRRALGTGTTSGEYRKFWSCEFEFQFEYRDLPRQRKTREKSPLQVVRLLFGTRSVGGGSLRITKGRLSGELITEHLSWNQAQQLKVSALQPSSPSSAASRLLRRRPSSRQLTAPFGCAGRGPPCSSFFSAGRRGFVLRLSGSTWPGTS